MEISTCSIVIGDTRCNAKCPFCISKMTLDDRLKCWSEELNIKDERNFKKLCYLINKSGITTILFTGKGEPTLHPEEISYRLEMIDKYCEVPFIELQTNGLMFMKYDYLDFYLKKWWELGLNTVSISIVSDKTEDNEKIYGRAYDLKEMIEKLHNLGMMVRLNVMAIKGIMSSDKFGEIVDLCSDNEVEQLTIREIEAPEIDYRNIEIYNWTKENKIFIGDIKNEIKNNADKLLMRLPHGAEIFQYKNINVCITNCMTENPDVIRQIIYYPSGKLMYSWQYSGARLL